MLTRTEPDARSGVSPPGPAVMVAVVPLTTVSFPAALSVMLTGWPFASIAVIVIESWCAPAAESISLIRKVTF